MVINQADMTESRSMPHQQGMRYKRQKSLTKHTMTLATRGWLFIYCNPLIHFHKKILTKRKLISTERKINSSILTN
jgi:hypothetical protein